MLTKQQNHISVTLEEQDLFPQIQQFSLSDNATNILRSQGWDVSKLQEDINAGIKKGGQAKTQVLTYAMNLSDRATGSRQFQGLIQSAVPMNGQQRSESFGSTTGTQNFFGNLWNNSIPAVVEGAGKLLYGALPAVFNADEKAWNERNKAVDDMVSPMMTYVDESFKNLTPVEWNRETGSLDLSNLTSARAWANTASQVIGFLLPTLATAGIGGALRAVGVAGKVAEGINLSGRFGQIVEGVEVAGKLDKFGKGLVATDMLTSTLQMFPQYQKEGLENGLTIGQATAFALPTAIAAGLVEIVGGEALAKGLGFTAGAEGRMLMRDIVQQNTAEALRTVTSKGWSGDAMQEVINGSLKKTLDDLGNPVKRGAWQKLAESRVGRAVAGQAFPEASEEVIQQGIEDMAKAIYNATTDKTVKAGQGRFQDFDSREFATNALFGGLLGGLMGTGMGMFHKSPKVFDQTLFSYINGDVLNQLQRGNMDFDSIAASLKANELSVKGLNDGIYDAAEKDAIDRKIQAMARVAYDFADVKEFTPQDRMAMFEITNIRDQIGGRAQEIEAVKQQIAQMQAELPNLSSSAAAKATIDIANLQQQLGGQNPQTGRYQKEDQLEFDKNTSEAVFTEVTKVLPDPNKRKGISKYIRNELAAKSDAKRVAQKFAPLSDGRIAVSEATEGRKEPVVTTYDVQPVVAPTFEETVATTGELPTTYQPTKRAELVPSQAIQSYDEYAAASQLLAKEGKSMQSETLTRNTSQDAQEVIDFGQKMSKEADKEKPWQESVDAVSKLYRYYKQIQTLDPSVPNYPTVREFEAAIGFERKNQSQANNNEAKSFIERLDEGVRNEAISLAKQYVEGYDGQNLPAHFKVIYDTLGSIRNLKDAWVRMMGNADDYPFRYEAKKGDTTSPRLDEYVNGLQQEGADVDEQDVLDFMQAYPGGIDRAKTAGLAPIRERFKELTGKTLNFPMAKRIADEFFKSEKQADNQQEAEGDTESEFGIVDSAFKESDFVDANEYLSLLEDDDLQALLSVADEYIAKYPAGQDWVHMLLVNAKAGMLEAFPPLSEQGQQLIAEAARRYESTSEEIRSYTNIVNQIINGYQQRKTRQAASEAIARGAKESGNGAGGVDQSQSPESVAPITDTTNGQTIPAADTSTGQAASDIKSDLVSEQERVAVAESLTNLGQAIEDNRAAVEQSDDETVVADYADKVESLVDQAAEQLRQFDQIAAKQSGNQDTGANGVEAAGEGGISRSDRLDAEAEAKKARIRELAAKFAKAGKGTANSSLIGVTPEQIGIAGEMLAELTSLGINRFEKAVVWLADNVGMDWLGENFEAFKMAYGAVKFARNDGEDLNAAAGMTLEGIFADPKSYLPESANEKPVSEDTPIQETKSLDKALNEDTATVGRTEVGTDITPIQLALFSEAIDGKTTTIEGSGANADTASKRVEVAKEAQAAIRDIDELLDAYFDNTGIRPEEVTEWGDVAADRKIRQAVTRLSKQLAKELGLAHETDKKGKKLYVSTNLTPSGGDVSFKLYVDAATAASIGQQIGVRVSVQVQRDYDTGNLTVQGMAGTDPIVWRVIGENGRSWENFFVPRDTTYAAFKQQLINELTTYGYTQPQITVPARSYGRKGAVSGAVQPGLFASDGGGQSTDGVSTASGGQSVGAGGANETKPQSVQPGGDTGNGMGDAVSAEPSGTGNTGDVRAGVVNDTQQAGSVETAQSRVLNTNNFVITPETVLVPTGEVGKVRANIAAIKTLKAIKAENRPATEEEKKVLVQYVGWGGLAEYLNETRYRQWIAYRPIVERGGIVPDYIRNWGTKYAALHEEILPLLTAEELRKAQGSTLTSYYTDRPVINAMWQVLERMGFTGGKMLEPSAGIGHFIGLMPESVKSNSEISAIELDTTSGEILKLLYPDAKAQVGGFEEFHPPIGSYDLVVGNIPFGQFSVYDGQHEDLSKLPIHNYFIGKSSRLVRPGGIVALITTSGTMDAASDKFRTWMRDNKMGLVTAVRLPSSAFSENAGTQVTTDILFFQKYADTNPFAKNIFSQSQSIRYAWLKDNKTILSDSQYESLSDFDKKRNVERVYLSVNEYFAANPQNLLGEMKFAAEVGSGGLYRGDQPTLYNPSKEDVQRRLAEFVDSTPKNIFSQEGQVQAETIKTKGRIRSENGRATLAGKAIADKEKVKLKGKEYSKQEVLDKYAILKELYLNQLAYEADNHPEIANNRQKLAAAYNDFVTKFGTLNENKALNFIEDYDIEYSTVQSLETVDFVREGNRRKPVIQPSAILSHRVIQKVEEPALAETLDDAIDISRSFRGSLQLDYVALLMQSDPQTIMEEIVQSGRGFMDPDSGAVIFRDDYLSGNVRKKLYRAKKLAETDSRFQPNVEALEKIVPPTRPISLINFQLGSAWVPTHIIERFINTTLNIEVGVRYNEDLKEYQISDYSRYAPLVQSMGTKHRNAMELIESALNSKPINIQKDAIGADGLPILTESGKQAKTKDVDAIAAATEARDNLNNQFVDFAKDNYASQLETIYNDTFNGEVEKTYSMPVFATYPGANPEIKLRDIQKRAVERIKEDDAYLAHGVGVGKTISAITSVMEMRRLGRATKALLVVQNSTVEQFQRTFAYLYPGASVYVPDEKDREAQNRKRFLQRIASNNFDAVIIPQSFLEQLPDDPNRINNYISSEINDIKAAIESETDVSLKRPLQKTMADMEKRLEAKLKKQADRKQDDILTFDRLGIDMIVLDEAHAYKRLGLVTKRGQVKGIDVQGSERALSAMMKVRHVQDIGGRVVMMSGTPISNTMAEAWTIMKFMDPKTLDDLGINTFDQFANVFGKVEPSFELTTAGNFKSVDRFASFINIPELSSAFRRKVDVVLTSDVREFKEDNTIPKLKVQTEEITNEDGKKETHTGPGYTKVILPQTPGIEMQLEAIREELKRFEEMTGQEKKRNSHLPLVMFGKAKKATLDLRLISSLAEDDPGSKVNRSIGEILRIYNQSDSYKGTQLVFADIFQSPEVKDKYVETEQGETILNPEYGKKRFNLFEDIRNKLIKAGVPASEVAIVPEDKKKRQAVFDKVVTGEVRVLLGTSERMGVGVNVQNKLAALHHLDAPQRPTDFEQRNGRILRQGNEHASMNIPVEVLTYGVEKTLDATSYQRLAIKQKFINQVLKGEISDSEMADISDDDEISSMSFDQMMATLSGSQYAVMYTKAKMDLSRLVQRKKNWERGVIEAKRNIEQVQKYLLFVETRLPVLEVEVKLVKARFGDTPKIETIEFGGKSYTDKWGVELDNFFKNMVSRYEAGLSSDEVIKVNGALVKLMVIKVNRGSLTGVPVIRYELGNEIASEVNTTSGFSNSLPDQIRGLYYKPERLLDKFKYHQELLDAYTKKLSQPFKEEEQLKKLEARVEELKAKMEKDAKPEQQQEEAQFSFSQNLVPTDNETLSNLLEQLRGRYPDIAINVPISEAEFAEEQKRLAGEVTETSYGFYDPNTGQIWLNPAKANANTPIHELGHVWMGWAKNNRPDLLSRGIELIRDSKYYKQLEINARTNPAYSTLTQSRLYEEALAIAIGDQGEAFVTNVRKRGFKEWLSELFDSVKEFLGIKQLDADQLQKLDLDRFTKMVAADILMGDKSADSRKSIEEKAKANGTWLKAPNGNPTNLSPSQWVSVRTDSFKKWFGDWESDPENSSKVVDENGEPLVTYHGSSANFESFNVSKKGSRGGLREKFFSFTSNKKIAEIYSKGSWGGNSGPVYETFLNIREMPTYDNEGKYYNELEVWADYKWAGIFDLQDWHNRGFGAFKEVDGFSVKNTVELDRPFYGELDNKASLVGTTYYVKFPNQIKSATYNEGSYSSDSDNIRFQSAGSLDASAMEPILFSFTAPQYDFNGNANAQPNLISSYADWSGLQAEYRSKIPTSILAKREADLTKADRAILSDLQKEYGYKYLGNGYSYLDLTESVKSFFTSNGGVAKIENFGIQSGQKGLIAQSALGSVVRLYDEKTWVGRMVRVLVDKFIKLTNVETLAELLDDGSGMMRSLVTEVKRLGGRNKSYVTTLMNPYRNRLSDAMKNLSVANGANDIWNVERVGVRTYAWDDALGVTEKQVEIPTATAMSLLLTAETQEASFQGQNSVVIQDRFLDSVTGQLLVNDRSVLYSSSKNVARGARVDHKVLEDTGGGSYTELDGITLVLSKDQLEALRERFYRTGPQAEIEAFALLKETINNQKVLDILREENDKYLNPNSVFQQVVDENGEPAYWPILSNDNGGATAQKQVGLRVNRTLEDSKLLIERNGVSQSVTVKDALDTIDEYQYRVENIVEHGRLAHNLKNIVNALQTDMGDNKLVKEIADILLDRALLLEDYRKYKADKRSHTQFEKIFNSALSRYTSSTFRLNFGIALKQLATFYSASGQSLLEDKYLFNAQSYLNLFVNSRGIFTDTLSGVGQDIVEGTDIGFKDAFGNDSSQAALLRELLGEHIADEAEKELWRRQFATVIDRVITANNQYIGGVDVDKFSWNDKGLGMLGKLFGRADAAMENVGMAPIKIGDRAVILAYYQAAKEQLADEIQSGKTNQTDANTRLAEIMESVLYSTNQMNKVADLTYLQTDTNWLSKLVGLYSGQQQKLFNVFLQGFLEWSRLRSLPDSDPAKIAAWDKVRKSFISNVIVVPLYMAGVTVAWKMLRNLLNGDEPEDEEYYQSLFLSSWANNGASVVPGITAQVLQSAISMVDGQPWEDAILDFPAEETFSGTINTFKDLYNYGAEEDPAKLETIKNSLSYNIERSFAGWTGTPRVVTQFTKEFVTDDKDDKK